MNRPWPTAMAKMSKFLSRLGPFSWTLHNLIAHPLSELVHLFGLGTKRAERLSNWIHDVTVPDPVPDTREQHV